MTTSTQPPNRLRPAAVAGYFYAADPRRLRADLAALLGAAPATAGTRPRALIVPHAGYVYSGMVAAEAYARLAPWRHVIRRVAVLGPAHRVAVAGIAGSSATAFATPLGQVAVDVAALAALRRQGVVPNDRAHAPEHALEVQLPFLQVALDDFACVPLLVDEPDPSRIAALLEPWWEDPEALIVLSTDLSHFLDYDAAERVDARTDQQIMALAAGVIGPDAACGCRPLNGLLQLAATRGAHIERVRRLSSGDTAGARDSVVGYAAYALH